MNKEKIELSYLIHLKMINHIKGLTGAARSIFDILLTFDIYDLYKTTDGIIQISINELAEYARYCPKSIVLGIERLVNAGLIQKMPKTNRSQANSYRVIAISEEEKQKIREEDAEWYGQQD